jgi:arsenite methyltransferase
MTTTPVAPTLDGTDLTRRLGYDRRLLDAVPPEAVESFTGVGNPLRVARLHPGERVLDLGSGSGTDLFAAALCVGPTGRVVGRDVAPAQLARAERLRTTHGFDNVELSDGPIESLPFADDSFDAVISNGVVHLSARKTDVFAEAARVLRPGGRMALSDIVIREYCPDAVGGGAGGWPGCVGGGARLDDYRTLMTDAGFEVLFARRNDYALVPGRAAEAASCWGIESVTILASCC